MQFFSIYINAYSYEIEIIKRDRKYIDQEKMYTAYVGTMPAEYSLEENILPSDSE